MASFTGRRAIHGVKVGVTGRVTSACIKVTGEVLPPSCRVFDPRRSNVADGVEVVSLIASISTGYYNRHELYSVYFRVLLKASCCNHSQSLEADQLGVPLAVDVSVREDLNSLRYNILNTQSLSSLNHVLRPMLIARIRDRVGSFCSIPRDGDCDERFHRSYPFHILPCPCGISGLDYDNFPYLFRNYGSDPTEVKSLLVDVLTDVMLRANRICILPYQLAI
jgi:hypothetical protein